MLRVERVSNERVILNVSGAVVGLDVDELERLVDLEGNGTQLVLDLKNVTSVDRPAVMLLKRCAERGTALEQCPGYIREWIAREPERRDGWLLESTHSPTHGWTSGRDSKGEPIMAAREPGTTMKQGALETYENLIRAQVQEVRVKLDSLEAKVREQKAQAEITAIGGLRAARENIERKLQDLRVTSDADVSRAKAALEAEVAGFKAKVEALAAKIKPRSKAK